MYQFTNSASLSTLNIENFRGADFSTHPAKVDLSRSPDMLNMIADETYFPVKRTGFKNTGITGSKVYGIHHYVDTDGTPYLCIHSGTKLDVYNGNVVANFDGMAEHNSASFTMDNKLYLLDGTNYKVFDGRGLKNVTDAECYIPTTLNGYYPDGTLPEGSVNVDEAVNLLSPWQKNLFIADEGIRQVDVIEIWGTPSAGSVSGTILGNTINNVTIVSGESLSDIAYDIANSFIGENYGTTIYKKEDSVALEITKIVPCNNFDHTLSLSGIEGSVYTKTQGKAGQYDYILSGTIDEGSEVTVKIDGIDTMPNDNEHPYEIVYSETDEKTNITTGKIRFNDSIIIQGYIPAPSSSVPGVPNVEITFKHSHAGADKINKCTINNVFGGNIDTRVFWSGNPNMKNSDWQSGLYDPTYFPDTSYTKIGSDRSAIVGYHKMYDMQLIIKEDDGQDSTQYLRTYQIDGSGKAIFPLVQGANSYGAVAPHSFAVLGDIPLYLSKDGVIGIQSTAVKQQTSMINMSRLINKNLHKEDLKNACAIVYDNKYYLSVGGHCYVADGKQRYSLNGEAQFEWYYWENINADCFAEYDGYLYFGTDTGLYRFYKSDELNAYNDDGAAINAYWTTPFSQLGQPAKYKSINDFYAVLMPYSHSGAKIYYTTDLTYKQLAKEENLDLFDFNSIDFSRFTFKTIQAATPIEAGVKASRIYLFQGIAQNDVLNEPFGLLGFVVKYKVGNFIKG